MSRRSTGKLSLFARFLPLGLLAIVSASCPQSSQWPLRPTPPFRPRALFEQAGVPPATLRPSLRFRQETRLHGESFESPSKFGDFVLQALEMCAQNAGLGVVDRPNAEYAPNLGQHSLDYTASFNGKKPLNKSLL